MVSSEMVISLMMVLLILEVKLVAGFMLVPVVSEVLTWPGF